MSDFFLIRANRFNPNDDEMLLNDYCIGEGDEIMKGDIVATVETSKSIVDIESNVSGKIIELLFKKGEMVKVGEAIIKIKLHKKSVDDSTGSTKINSIKKVTKESNKTTKDSNLRKKLDKRKKELVVSDKVYRKNYLNNFPDIEHGKNCYISINVTLENVVLGDSVWINRDTNIFSSKPSKPVRIGNGSYIGPNIWIEGHNGIKIGNCVQIAGPSTCLYTHSGMKTALQGNYSTNPESNIEYDEFYYEQSINIGNNVWIGPNSTIFPGVNIEDNVVIMPNTLVKSGNIEKYSLVNTDGSIEKNSPFVINLSKK